MSNQSVGSNSENVRGYISEEHKRKFTITAGVLGAVFFVAQFVLPFIVMIAFMPTRMFFQSDWLKDVEIERGILWQGEIWYIEQTVGNESTARKTLLKKLSPGSDEEPITVAEISIEEPWLLADTERLWIISSSSIGYYKDAEIVLIPMTKQLGDITRPFLYDGNPTIIEETPEGSRLAVFNGNNWIKGQKLLIEYDDSPHISRNLQVVSQGDIIYTFLKFGSTLYYRKGLPPITLEDYESWQSVCSIGRYWYVTIINEQPAVFQCRRFEGSTTELKGIILSKDSWKEFFSHELRVFDQFAVFPLKDMKFFIVTSSFLGSLSIIEVESGKVVQEMRYGRTSFFSRGMMVIMFIPYLGTFVMPLILALILSSLMRKHRVCKHDSKGSRVPFASLIRRAVAQIIDAAIFAGPGIVGWLAVMLTFFDFEKMFTNYGTFGPLSVFVLMFVGLGWVFLCLLIFSWLEGKYGRTPGKWIMGIKVLGTDLSPCGFGRALVRNLLKFVDGFFNFLVGVMIIALSENWQRVGDMAARTIVIDTRKKA